MNKNLTIGKTRSLLYKAGKILGDVNSVKRGTVGKRVTNRLVGKASGKLSAKVSRTIFKIFK